MSQGNVDIIRELWEAVNETKLPAFDLLHPEVNWQTRADLLDSDTYRGHDGVAKLAATGSARSTMFAWNLRS